MFHFFFDQTKLLLSIDLQRKDLPFTKCWLLRSDGSIAQKLQLTPHFQFDCRQLDAGNWFVKIEMPGYTGLKIFTINSLMPQKQQD